MSFVDRLSGLSRDARAVYGMAMAIAMEEQNPFVGTVELRDALAMEHVEFCGALGEIRHALIASVEYLDEDVLCPFMITVDLAYSLLQRAIGPVGRPAGKVWAQLRERAFFEHGAKCYYCSAPDPTHVDHQVPLSRGGSNHPLNLVPCCQSCNLSKGSKLDCEWSLGL